MARDVDIRLIMKTMKEAANDNHIVTYRNVDYVNEWVDALLERE